MPLSNDEIQEIDQPGITTQEKVAKLARFALTRLGSTNPENPSYSSTIREQVSMIYPEIFRDISESTFVIYLNRAPTIDQQIVSLGTARGYYLDQTGQTTVIEESVTSATPESDDADTPLAPESSGRLQRELKLYPHVANWLAANGYRARVVAQGRALGPWGNPDVVGIQTLDLLGFWHAQTISIEVKLSSQNWARDIFEAISHRRYFDRSYFCYPVPANNRQISEEMKDYAELYEIGILLMEMAPSEFVKLNKAQDLDENNISVTEVCPAPFHLVMPKYRKLAFDALEITGLDSLFAWGRPSAQ
jgi:hypothetical protein